MIKFYGRMYDSNTSTWLDEDFIEYSIATSTNESISIPPRGMRVDNVNPDDFIKDSATNLTYQMYERNPLSTNYGIRVYFDDTDLTKNYCYIYADALWINYNGHEINNIFLGGSASYPPYLHFVFNCINIESVLTNLVHAGGLYYSSSRKSWSLYGGLEPTTAEIQTIYNLLTLKPAPPPEPSFPGNTSGTGGGTGSFDITSDNIDFPSVPTLSAVSAGFITLFAPTVTQLNNLAAYLWSSSFDLDTFKRLFANPMDLLIGLSIVPVSVPTSGATSVKVGFIDTGVAMNLATNQYVTIDCGSLTTSEYWGSALDYSPYTKFSIYLPYIGTRELKTDDIMGKTLQVKYNIDILSGACTAMVKCGNAVLYEFSGACASSIPVTGQNWTQLLTSAIQLAGAGIAVAATGGSAAGLLPSAANAVAAMKPNVQRTGAVSGSAGMLGIQNPYLIWELPRQSLAKNYNTFVGYPSNISSLLNDLTGFTQIESVHLENISATQTELAEIETLLKEGVII